jgi:hypothetical protein
MKKISIIIFVILLLVAGVWLVFYMRRVREGNTVSTIQTPEAGNVVQSPLPTVAQIPLTITSPASGSSSIIPTVIIKGVTSPTAEVFINDAQVTADARGNFTVQVTLDEGENTLVVTANDANGNYSEQDLIITYNSE